MPQARFPFILMACLGMIIAAVVFWGTGFTVVQSVLLGAVAILAIGSADSLFPFLTPPAPQFQAFWISIQPKWDEIHKDYRLATDEKLREVSQRWVSQREALLKELYQPTVPLSPLRRGVTFVVVRPDLWFSSDLKAFFAGPDWSESIYELSEPSKGVLQLPISPEFYVKRTHEKRVVGFEFGIVTETTRERAIGHLPGDEGNQPLAFLPEQIFAPYYHGEWTWDESRKAYEEGWDQLANHGWTEEEEEELDMPGMRYPTTLEHRYFTISFKGLRE